MRRLIIALLLLAGAVMLLPGCFFGEARHDAYHMQVLERDMQALHENWDWFWKSDRPTMLHLRQDYWHLTERP